MAPSRTSPSSKTISRPLSPSFASRPSKTSPPSLPGLNPCAAKSAKTNASSGSPLVSKQNYPYQVGQTGPRENGAAAANDIRLLRGADALIARFFSLLFVHFVEHLREPRNSKLETNSNDQIQKNQFAQLARCCCNPRRGWPVYRKPAYLDIFFVFRRRGINVGDLRWRLGRAAEKQKMEEFWQGRPINRPPLTGLYKRLFVLRTFSP